MVQHAEYGACIHGVQPWVYVFGAVHCHVQNDMATSVSLGLHAGVCMQQ